MNDQQRYASDNIPVLSDVVIPGTLRVSSDSEHAPTHAQRLKAQAEILLAEMHQRIERMVEEELAHAHSSALETARFSLQQRLRVEMEERLNAFIADAVLPHGL